MGNIRAFKLSIRLGEQRKEGEEFRFPGRSSSVFPVYSAELSLYRICGATMEKKTTL